MATQVPMIVFTPQGVVAPTGPAVLAGVQADINAAFQTTLSYDIRTPQGQLSQSESAVIVDTNGFFTYYVNQVDPAFSSGRMQDAIARIYFLTRLPAEPTVLQVLCAGRTDVVIPLSAKAKDAAGNIYQCTSPGTIGVGGSVTLPFAAIVPGPLAIPQSVAPYQTIPGWDSTTVLSGVIGQNTESRSQFEERRRQSVAKNSVGQLNSVLGEVLSVPGVLDAYVTENVEATPIIIQGVSVAAKSIYVAAVGGLAADVAAAIWRKKSPGCAYNGNTTVIVYDETSGYSPPLPSYAVSFETPDSLAILYTVIITDGPQVPSNADALIQSAIIAAFSGQDGGTRARIGSTIYASRYVTPVVALGSWVQLQQLTVGSNNNVAAIFTAAIASNVLTVSGVTSGAIAIENTISDSAGAIIPGTRIEQQLSGPPGGVGSYRVSISQTVTSRLMRAAASDRASVATQIDQSPTLVAANIKVILV